MIQTISLLLLILVSVISLTTVVILLIWRFIAEAINRTNKKQLERLRRSVVFFITTVILNSGIIALSQVFASTPKILDKKQNIPPKSITELAKVELNGRKQWISIRGFDDSKPVLLFLAGGPGGTQMAAVRHDLAELEKHFIVVGWDQPGAGKSYYAQAIKDITVETYISDGYALTRYLTQRFGQEKIYLVGESWGSAMGFSWLTVILNIYMDLWYRTNGRLL